MVSPKPPVTPKSGRKGTGRVLVPSSDTEHDSEEDARSDGGDSESE